MSLPSTDPASQDAYAHEQEGFRKSLSARQMQMIAIGSAIGTGLFLGAGGRLETAGPSLFLLYAVCGFFGYLMLRSLGELVVHRPSSGSFVSYAREFYGERSAFVSGWLYWMFWAMTAVADATALALYFKWFSRYEPFAFIDAVPQWVLALVIVVLVVSLNLLSVKVFGELEFWFSLIKVGALVVFLVVGTLFVLFGTPTGSETGFALISQNGGLFPNGAVPAVVMIAGVVFAYAGIELVGTTAGETAEPEKQIPRAINSVIFRIAVFYCGSVLLLCLLLPYTAYSGHESPFVTFFSSIGVDAAGPIMQLVVITAAMSSMNAGIYSTGRILHSMSVAGSAPRFAQRLSSSGVPTGGILLTAAMAMVGVALNIWVPEQAFEIVLNIGAVGVMAAWVTIVLSHQRFVRLARQGVYERPAYRNPTGIVGDWAVIAFIVVVFFLIAIDYPVGSWTLGLLVVVVGPALVIGWFCVRGRVMEQARLREGHTGQFPIGTIVSREDTLRDPGDDMR
ncbi:amino acid permease [Kocuria palustris]|uniref:amino acid permease n=1 Tax=Kocuria palustris TaxID=71999 RepID=UPI0011A0339D|nr:amino acid permease [Kocuria palustris]